MKLKNTKSIQVGERAKVKLKNGLVMEVRVLEQKFTYGKSRYLITPVAGSGKVWVQNILA